MRLTFLGTGTSTGIPQLRCGCATCTSSDPRDRRMRCAALLDVKGKRILIDCGPDFYQQMLIHGKRSEHDVLDALIVTHQHYDHVGGVDDLRPYCAQEEFIYKGFPIYCQDDVAQVIKRAMPYSFQDPLPRGVPRLDLHEISDGETFTAAGVEILPLRISHYLLEILGFRIGNLGYITDAKIVPDSTVKRMTSVDTLVINALRRTPHPSHMSLDESLAVIERIKPRVAYLTHIAHEMGTHAETETVLPPGVFLAYDGLTIEIPDQKD
ncbi:MAG: MBL fold metallo-hydrolase [Muribaculaceae bacterium]|nr:MBL fold metallo-hydrolase [Muribaculaceae bacterium]